MYIYTCIYIYIYLYMYVYIYIYIFGNVYSHASTHVLPSLRTGKSRCCTKLFNVSASDRFDLIQNAIWLNGLIKDPN